MPHRNICIGHSVASARQYTYATVGADIIRPPTLQIFEQNRIGQAIYKCCKCTMFRRNTIENRLQIFDTAIVGAQRRRCFPGGETTGRLIAAPTQTYRIALGA